MRKRICMGIMLVAAAMAACCLYLKDKNNVLLSVEGGLPCAIVRTAQSENRVFLWQDEEGNEDVGKRRQAGFSCRPV